MGNCQACCGNEGEINIKGAPDNKDLNNNVER